MFWFRKCEHKQEMTFIEYMLAKRGGLTGISNIFPFFWMFRDISETGGRTSVAVFNKSFRIWKSPKAIIRDLNHLMALYEIRSHCFVKMQNHAPGIVPRSSLFPALKSPFQPLVLHYLIFPCVLPLNKLITFQSFTRITVLIFER